jgi:hypothetical protein
MAIKESIANKLEINFDSFVSFDLIASLENEEFQIVGVKLREEFTSDKSLEYFK